MSTPPAPASRLDVPVRRMAAAAAILFVLVLAFLAGRVRSGADPAQSATPASQQQPPIAPTDSQQLPGAVPGQDQQDPWGGGAPPSTSDGTVPGDPGLQDGGSGSQVPGDPGLQDGGSGSQVPGAGGQPSDSGAPSTFAS
jgi:hypothetical protein